MITPEGTPEYHPTPIQKATAEFNKRAPYIIDKILRTFLTWAFRTWQFLIQMFKDAFNR